MKSSSSNSEEVELQQMKLDERDLHKKCLAWFEKLKKHLGFLRSSFNITNTRLFEIAFRIFFREEHQTFREKMYHNLNQLQWQLERDNFHGHDSKTCLVVLRTQVNEFFESKEVNASDVPNKKWKESFIDGTKWEPKNFRSALLWVLEELDKLNDERALKYGELRMKESEVKAIKENEKRLKESELQQQESLVTQGAVMEACLVTEEQLDESSSSETTFNKSEDENKISNKDSSSSEGNDADVDIGSSNDNKYEKHRAFFASLINNLKSDVEKCNEVNREAQLANALLTNELERYKEKEKYFAKDMIIESEYCNKSKLLSDEISNLKSQPYEKDKTFAKENEKFDELRKAGETDQTLRMLLPKEDNVNTGKQGIVFENQNDYVNPSLLNKAKELAPYLYNIDEMGKDELSDHKIISKEELKCKAEKRLKVKQRKSLLSYHGFVFAKTQFKEPPKVPLKKKKCQFERTFGTSLTEKL
ncbi:hypothetical protein Tco_0682792 [Tanacetum coccineum]|uniref:Uncharacterized protein n=1 Tax=Tanacetum coccineum TaxID=301880 RepID=A0ABQ4XT99_9ASTR